MTDLLKNPDFLKGCLREMSTRLQYPGSKSAREIVQDGCVAEALLYILARLDALEANRV